MRYSSAHEQSRAERHQLPPDALSGLALTVAKCDSAVQVSVTGRYDSIDCSGVGRGQDAGRRSRSCAELTSRASRARLIVVQEGLTVPTFLMRVLRRA
jgi:hypothetical protein